MQPPGLGAVISTVSASTASEPQFTHQAAALLQELVRTGAALGWVEPPPDPEVAGLLVEVAAGSLDGSSCLVAASIGAELAGIGYWQRYPRPTHRINADVQKVAVKPTAQRCGLGRAIMDTLIRTATEAGIETLTLDVRGDNHAAMALYRSLGFSVYGRLRDFVGVGDQRYDKVLFAMDLRTR